MYDPEIHLNPRFAADCKVGDFRLFQHVPASMEPELKVLTDPHSLHDFDRIRSVISNQRSRRIDAGSTRQKPNVLVTLNLDTIDPQTRLPTEKIRQAGYSLRVRFELDVRNYTQPPKLIDIASKTLGSQSFIDEETGIEIRGEWEAALPSLNPDLDLLIAANHSEKPPLPEFFRELDERELVVQSIGCTWRRSFNSAHILPNFGCAAIYEHTEDCNIFTTPQGYTVAGFDNEAEAELKGFWGRNHMPKDEIRTATSLTLRQTQNLLTGISPQVIPSPGSKADRAYEALAAVLQGTWDVSAIYKSAAHARMTELTPQEYALWQNVKAPNVNLEAIIGILAKLKKSIDRQHQAGLTGPQKRIA